jgi:hypothetical protein
VAEPAAPASTLRRPAIKTFAATLVVRQPRFAACSAFAASHMEKGASAPIDDEGDVDAGMQGSHAMAKKDTMAKKDGRHDEGRTRLRRDDEEGRDDEKRTAR